MNYRNIIMEKGEVTTIKIDRPQSLNALNSKLLSELNNIFKNLRQAKEVKTIIITGNSGKAFVAGADIQEMKSMDPTQARNFAEKGHNTFKKIKKISIPVIAAINGFALGGGCELALSCDIRLASENAVFGQPETGLGIIPGFGGTQHLAQVVGESRAKEIIFTGNNIDAYQAKEIGLVNHVYETQEKLLQEAKKLAKEISNKAPLAIEMAKDAINFGLNENIDNGLSYEKNLFSLCFNTKDQEKGMKAFIDNKDIEFSGE